VGEGIVSAIGSAHSYKEVLENPDRISKTVLAKGWTAIRAFEILSIDIADVDVGDNIGAKLQTEQAEADKRVAQAKAEVRRAAAVAVEQEMRAKTQEMRAKVVEAEALVPQAMADAFRSGNWDYGLCADEKCSGRHLDARIDRRRRQAANGRHVIQWSVIRLEARGEKLRHM